MTPHEFQREQKARIYGMYSNAETVAPKATDSIVATSAEPAATVNEGQAASEATNTNTAADTSTE